MSQCLWIKCGKRNNACVETLLQWRWISSDITVLQFLTKSFINTQHYEFVRLEESGVVTDCRIRTIYFDPVLDYDFASANVVSKIIMNSDTLKEIFGELDATSESVQFTVSPDSQHFRITTFGISGIYHVMSTTIWLYFLAIMLNLFLGRYS